MTHLPKPSSPPSEDSSLPPRPALMFITTQGLQVPLPAGWTEARLIEVLRACGHDIVPDAAQLRGVGA